MASKFNLDPKKCPMPSQDPHVRNKNISQCRMNQSMKNKGFVFCRCIA